MKDKELADALENALEFLTLYDRFRAVHSVLKVLNNVSQVVGAAFAYGIHENASFDEHKEAENRVRYVFKHRLGEYVAI